MSCIRDSTRRVAEKETSFDQSFVSCEHFALAFDTALFGQEHVLSCIVRFVFHDKITQLPLFMRTCTSSTGEDFAVFIYNELRRMKVPFNKLSCVTTDGAANMMGATNGMISHLKRMIVREHGIYHCILEPVWCFSHRLNLVIQCFQHVPFIQSVFRFCDWFTTKRKAVGYKKWLKETHPNDQLRKIPKPSETRWSFYKDTLEVLISQLGQVDEFLCTDKDFDKLKTTIWPCETAVPIGSGSFFQDKLVLAHFRFAFFVLERVHMTNNKLQERYLVLPHAWLMINKFKEDFRVYRDDIQSITFSYFDFLGVLTNEQQSSFLEIIDAFLLNMEVRFPCPSLSMDMRVAKQHVDQNLYQINPSFAKEVGRRCPLQEMVGLFLFPEDLIRKREINPFFLSEQFPEVSLMACEILEKADEIILAKNISQQKGTVLERNELLTLMDVFMIIQRDKYPLLWKTASKVLSIMPTSVECEQSFSCLKNKMHLNMTKENAINLFLSSRGETE